MNILLYVLYMDCGILIVNVNWCWIVEWLGINILCEDCEIVEYFNYGIWYFFLWWNLIIIIWRIGDFWYLLFIDIMRNYMVFFSYDKLIYWYLVVYFWFIRYLISWFLVFCICKVGEYVFNWFSFNILYLILN